MIVSVVMVNITIVIEKVMISVYKCVCKMGYVMALGVYI